MTHACCSAHYYIIAQHSDDRLTIGIKDEKLCFIKKAGEIISDQLMLQNFSVNDAALIGIIAGMQIERKNINYLSE